MVKIKTPKPGTLDVRTATSSYTFQEPASGRSKTERPLDVARRCRRETIAHLENARDQATQLLAVLQDVLDDKTTSSGTQLVLDTFELFNEAAWITRALQDALEDAKTCQWAEDGCR